MNIRPSAKPQVSKWGEGYEPHDVEVGWLFGVLLFMAIAAVTVHLVLLGFMKSLKAHPTPTDRWSTAARPPGETQRNKTIPRLQISPTRDLHQFRKQEEQELASYGWVNKTAGVVRIPIDRAMDLALQKGFPVRAGANQTEAGPSPLQLQQQRAK
jgi:hypothetical protein